MKSPTLMNVDQLVSLTISFQNGVPFDVSGRLYAYAFTAGRYGEGYTVMADFSNTAILTVLDLPAGAALVADSGQTYPVPEPASAALLGLCGVALPRRRGYRAGTARVRRR